MKSTIDQEDMIYEHLKSGPLVSQITGKLYKRERPVNSEKEDVVISSLSTNNLQLQTGVININIHVPNLTIKSLGVQQKVSDTARLKQLYILSEPELQDKMIGDSYFNIHQQIFFSEETSSYINIRLEFYNINISN